MTAPPWHQLCTLRDDVRSDELALAEFAADPNAVRTGDAPVVYGDAAMFFDRTYPTFRTKELTARSCAGWQVRTTGLRRACRNWWCTASDAEVLSCQLHRRGSAAGSGDFAAPRQGIGGDTSWLAVQLTKDGLTTGRHHKRIPNVSA